MDIDSFFPKGPILGVFDATESGAEAEVQIEITVKEYDAILNTEFATSISEVHQMAGAAMAVHTTDGAPATFVSTRYLELTDLPNLCSAWTKHETGKGIAFDANGKQVLFGVLTLHPKSMGSNTDFDIIAKRVYCEAKMIGEFSSEGLVRVETSFFFSADFDKTSETYGKTFTLGDFTPLQK